ncbi:aryl-hydrocarbon-interacting protein-like 1 [Betta splendens]|uniref:Aryl-hydrocarbon-interacting protein-like 1 n=1 Tax=Betta splendens TaxID=158456 RepID=A0A8M1HJD5_BETSP|nr:aryl-hydrocarbon-interacting protein-like 1 [Betta splendens]
MEETYLLNYPGVRKKILSGGTGPMPHFPPGTKLVFHFQTLLDNFERTVVDDSRLAGRPAEIFVGKMFKMEVWETLLTSMRVGEVAEFWCDAVHTGLYPIVSKGMRLIAQGKDPLESQRHMCGMGNLFHYHSTGFPELDELMRTPQPLIFIMELLQVGDPMSYYRESWMMEKDEKLQTVPVLHMQGNSLVKQRQFREAASKYKEAVLLLKTVQSREMPGDIDYINLGRMIVPLELNYCQCMLELEEYYEVIEHTTELLEKHKDCVKGYYKRAKAHAAVWNEKEARRDFHMVAQLDVTLASLVHRELKALSERMKEKYWEEREKYWNMLDKKETGREEEEEEEEEEADERASSDCKEEESQPKGEVGGMEDDKGDKEEASSSEAEAGAPDKSQGKDWQQMLRLILLLQSEGSFLIREKRFQEASVKLKEAVEYVDTLQNTVDRRGEDWESLEKVRLPLTLNLSQCMLELKQYQEVVELNSKLLRTHEGNFKAVYQRARAHAALCNEDEARRDLEAVEKLDPKFKPFVRQELKKLCARLRTAHALQNKTYWDTTQEKWGPGGSKAKGGARKKNGKASQKATAHESEADKNSDESQIEREKGTESAAAAAAETERDDDAKGEVGEHSNKVLDGGRESEEGSDNENIECAAVRGDGQGLPDNHTADKDSNPVPTSTGHDNVVCKRSACDKSREKVKCQSNAAAGPSEAGRGISVASDKTGDSGAQSE